MSRRPQMLASVIRRIAATFAQDIPPEVSTMVSVTSVDVRPDLSAATVYVSALERPVAALSYLRSIAKQLRSAVAREVRLYRVPELVFRIDDRPEKLERLERILSDKKSM